MDSEDASRAERVLRCHDLTKRFGGFVAVRDVNISVSTREILGIIGPNGAGKTTLFNLIAGSVRPNAGTVEFRGDDITRLPPHRRTRRGIGRTFQLIDPFVSMTIHENVLTTALANGRRGVAAEALTRDVIDRVGLTSIAATSAGTINAVQGKRLEVARALAAEPTLVLLDEIFAGLNVEEVDEAVELVRQLRADGLTVLIIEHNVRAIRAVADRVVALVAGEVVSEGEPEHVFSDPTVLESYLGDSVHA